MANRKSISPAAFMASYSSHPAEVPAHHSKPSDRPVSVTDIWIANQWRKLAVWPDGTKTLHGRYEVYPTRTNGMEYLEAPVVPVTTETRQQANRRKAAQDMADVLRSRGISAGTARVGGLGAVTTSQQIAQDNFRAATAYAAGRNGYLPSDATWELVCSMLEVAQ